MKSSQTGQTLIETLVAAFVLSMGIAAALGLANYSLNSISGIRNQIIGIGLAREGVEAMKNMRDTNWLVAGPLSTGCYQYTTGTNTGLCYPGWLNTASGFDIDSGSTQSEFRVQFNSDTAVAPKFWQISRVASSGNWGLATSGSLNAGYYTHGDVTTGQPAASSGFYRQIIVSAGNEAPFNQLSSSVGRVYVVSRVWWRGARCPDSAVWPGEGKCSISLRLGLTNWKNY